MNSELRYENEKLAENSTARFESANVEIWEEFNAKLSSESRVVSDKVDNVSRDSENKITTQQNTTIKNMWECLNEWLNAQVVQTRRETDWQGQEITAALSSLLASIREHKEHIGVTIDNLSQDISKSKAHVYSKFRTVSGEVQDVRQHSACEISRLSVTLGDVQAKLVTRKADHSSPAVSVNALSGQSGAAGTAISRADSNNTVPSMHGPNCVNGCSTSVWNDVNSVIN